MHLLLPLIEVLAACFMAVMAAPVPGVTEVNRTLSCCGEVKISIIEGCVNTFVIGNTTLARVEGTDASVKEPFQYRSAEGVMLLRKCEDFTHESTCSVGVSWLSVEITHYQLTQCSKTDDPPDAAAAIQGSLLYLVLPIAVMVMMRMFR